MMERERQRTVDGRTDTALVLEDRPNEKTLATLSTSAIIRHQVRTCVWRDQFGMKK